MLLNIPLAIIFLSDCLWALADFSPKKVPYVINEPFGPNSNGPLHLEMLKNMDSDEKAVKLNLEWQYESSTVKNDIRSINPYWQISGTFLRPLLENSSIKKS